MKTTLSRTVIFVICLSVCTSAFGQGLSKMAAGPVDPLKNPYLFYAKSLDERNDYLTSLLQFERHEPEYMAADQTKYLVPDLMAYLNAYVGRYDKALAIQERSWGESEHQPDIKTSTIDDYTPEPALHAIEQLAGTHQVVMINEEHVTPQHRAFTRDLLPIMWAKGFRYFAAETFNEDIESTVKKGYPNQKTGFYSDDPVFGDMVRTALKLGFKLISYEDRRSLGCKNPEGKPDFCQNERERGQAQNLYDRTLKIDPDAKVFVHVGRGHNQKIKMEGWAMMGWHFKDISGVDPLAIDQMHSERSDRRYEAPIYRYASEKWNLAEPTVFRNKSGEFWQGYGQDVVVFHPRTRYINRRANWLITGGRHGIQLARELHPHGEKAPFLVQAFAESEGEDAIPVDQIISSGDRSTLCLVLRDGSYRIRVLNSEGTQTLLKHVKVKSLRMTVLVEQHS